MNRRGRLLLTATGLVAAGLLAIPVTGARADEIEYEWTGDGGDNNWSTAGNWQDEAIPAEAEAGSGDTVTITFPDVAKKDARYNLLTKTFDEIDFTAGGYTISAASGSQLTLTELSNTAGENRFAVPLHVPAGGLGVGVGGGTLVLDGPVSGPGSVTKSGSGRLELPGANSFSGGLTISDGVVAPASGGSLGASSSAVTVATNNGTLELPAGTTSRSGTVTVTGANPVTVPAESTATLDAPVALSGTTTTFDLPADRALRLTGGVSGADNHVLTKNGAGALELGGHRAHGQSAPSAGTVVNAGVLRLTGGRETDPAGAMRVVGTSNNSILELVGSSARVTEALTLQRGPSTTATLRGSGGATVAGNVSITSTTGQATDLVPIDVTSGRLTISGRIGDETEPNTNDRGIEKLGAGTLVLSGGAPMYERTITARAGTVLVNSAMPNVPVEVPAGSSATVGGTGTIESLEFAGGGAVQPGASAGTLTVRDDATLTNDVTLVVDLNGAAPASYDRLVVDNTLTLGAARLAVRFGYLPEEGDTFDIATAGTRSGLFGGLGEGSLLAAGGHTLRISYAVTDGDGNDVVRLTVVEVGEPTEETTGVVTRLWGADRIETGVAVSKHGFPAARSAEVVVLARSDDYADALAGTPLAVLKGGPLLVTPTTVLHPDVADEIDRVLAPGKFVYVLGGELAISPEVEDAVADAGYIVVRLAGPTRYETAVAIASDGLDDPDTILLATGINFPDALAGAAAASAIDGAVLLTNGNQSHPATTEYLADRDGLTVYALGGPAAAAHPGATAIVGEDRYETATRTATELFDLDAVETVGIATGLNFPDALTGGAHTGHHGGPLVLTHPEGVPPTTRTWLQGRRGTVTRAYVYGGPVAVSTAVVNDIAGLLDQGG